MSLIVARKKGVHIYLVSDTKLTFPQEKFPDKKLAAPGDGVIKIALLNPQICIAFAGDDYGPAENAIAYCRKNQLLPSKIRKHLLEVNQANNKGIEFILAVGFPEYAIYEIKDLKVTQTESAWIGSNAGFNVFQETALENSGDKKFDNVMDEAMDFVLKSGRVPEVMGFRVAVTNEGNFFHYKNYMSTMVPARTYTFKGGGSHTIEIYGTPQEGGYTVSFLDNEGRPDVLSIHVRQGEFGVLYEMRNHGLLWPTVISDVDEHEFNDVLLSRHGIKNSIIFSSLQKSYFNRGNKSIKKNDYSGALALYDLGLQQNEDALRPHLLFNSGLVLLQLNRINEACERFHKAVKLDQKFEPLVQKALFSR